MNFSQGHFILNIILIIEKCSIIWKYCNLFNLFLFVGHSGSLQCFPLIYNTLKNTPVAKPLWMSYLFPTMRCQRIYQCLKLSIPLDKLASRKLNDNLYFLWLYIRVTLLLGQQELLF